MVIDDTWSIRDPISGLKIEVVKGEALDHLHIESLKGASVMNRDFWFTKEGTFDGTGSDTVQEGP